PGFPTRVISQIALPPLTPVIRRLRAILDSDRPSDRVHALAIMGDLTSRGNLKSYVACVTYMEESLLSKPSKFDRTNVVVVPGNHDIDRKNYSKRKLDKKFYPLNKALTDHGLPEFSLDGFKTVEIAPLAGPTIKIFGLNSCIGSGEKRYLPPLI